VAHLVQGLGKLIVQVQLLLEVLMHIYELVTYAQSLVLGYLVQEIYTGHLIFLFVLEVVFKIPSCLVRQQILHMYLLSDLQVLY